MKQDSLSIPFFASCAVHIAVILLASITLRDNLRRQDYIPIEIVDLPPTETPTPIRKIEKPPEIKRPLPSTPKVEKPKEPKPVVKNAPAKLEPPAPALTAPVNEGPAKSLETKSAKPAEAEAAPSFAAGARVEGSGSEAGAGNLFGRGDVGVVPGTGTTGGGGKANSGLGQGSKSEGAGGGGIRSAEAPTSLARPRGGYQVRPLYPASARRAGAQGTTVLKLQVLENGKVGEVVIEKSAGKRDLDNAAVDAVRNWLFEPARVGKRPVAVWVLLPVKFELK